MRLEVHPDYDAMSISAARFIESRMRKKPDMVLGLATGETPVGLYKCLVRLHEQEGLDFSRVITFNLDEYIGIPKDDPRSYHSFMWRHLYSWVNANPKRVHIPDGMAIDPVAEAERYEKEIAEAGGIDLQVLGIGMNGHIGFNEPGVSLGATTQPVRLARETIEVNRAKVQADYLPDQAVSMGIKTIMRAREILLLASGRAKASIVAQALEGPVTSMVPASVLQLHPNLVCMIDREAAAALRSA